jgi:hypothetical protein
MEMTMSVTGDERTEHSATTAAVGVTYWATEFERIYSMTAAGICAKRALTHRDIPRDRIALNTEPLTFSPSEEPPMTVKAAWNRRAHKQVGHGAATQRMVG